MLRVFRSGIDFIKKAFLVFVVFGVVFAIFGSVINNNRPRYDEKKVLQATQKELHETFSREKLGIKKGSGKDLILSLYRMGYCAFMGELCTEKLTYDTNAFKSSFMGQASNLISMTYVNPPASGVYWVTNTLQNAGFIPQSYAAEGMGFAMIKPLMNLWKIFRDIAYLIIVVILIGVGFMIMFRAKINPQTVISVENSLPKVVVALLLITFSFAIAGFLIDFMYLLIILAIGILSNNSSYYNVGEMQNHYLQANFITLWQDILPVPKGYNRWLMGGTEFAYIGDAFMTLLPAWVNYVFQGAALLSGLWWSKSILNLWNNIGIGKFVDDWIVAAFGIGKIGGIVNNVTLWAVLIFLIPNLFIHGLGFIIGLIVSLAILGMVFNIFFMLLKSYIQITLTIIFSPIILLFEAIPGNNNFSFWLKGLIGELLTFPIVITLLLTEKVMFSTLSYPGELWGPPFLWNLNPSAFSAIFGLGVILITPDIVKLVKDSVGAKPLPFNIGVNTFMGGGSAILGGGMGILQQFSTLSLGMKGISDITSSLKGKGPETDYDKMLRTKREKEVREWMDASKEKG